MAKEKRFALRLLVNLPAELWGVDDVKKKMQGFDPASAGSPKPDASHNNCSPEFIRGERSENFLCGMRLVELSPSGCKVYLEKQELSLPSDLIIKFGLEKAIPFNFSAEIVWSNKSDEKTYIGMKFKNLTMHDKEKIRRYIHDLKYISRDGYTM